jgi:hypothetical protein
MKKKNETEKVCPCGRIITDPNNKTGLCPKCQKRGNSIGAALGIAGVSFIAKKYGGKILKGAVNIIKVIKK